MSRRSWSAKPPSPPPDSCLTKRRTSQIPVAPITTTPSNATSQGRTWANSEPPGEAFANVRATFTKKLYELPVFFFVVVFREVFFDGLVFVAPPDSAAVISFHCSAGISSMLALAITRSAAFCS